MVRKSVTPPVRTVSLPPWRRRRRRYWACRDGTAAVSLSTMMPALSREALGRLADCMIERMDELDGDTDMEDFNGDA